MRLAISLVMSSYAHCPVRRLGRPQSPPALTDHCLGLIMAAAPRGVAVLDFEVKRMPSWMPPAHSALIWSSRRAAIRTVWPSVSPRWAPCRCCTSPAMGEVSQPGPAV